MASALLDAMQCGEPCPYCGTEEPLSLLEAWDLEWCEWQVDACCESAEQDYRASWQDRGWMKLLDIEHLAGNRVRGVVEEGLPSLDFVPHVGAVSQKDAFAFISEHHRHVGRPAGWKCGFGVYNGDRLVAVAVLGRPVARMTDASRVLEVTRLCTADTELSRHAASMLYGACAREAKRRGVDRVQTFTREDEAGTSLIAAGWRREGMSRGGSWARAGRQRADRNTVRKWRWSKVFRAEAGT